LGTCGSLLASGKANQSNNAAVSLSANNGELAKVLVERDEHASLLECRVKDGLVTWVCWPLAAPGDIVAGCLQLRASSAPKRMSRVRASRRTWFDNEGLDSLVTDEPTRILDARQNVCTLHPGVTLDDCVDVIAGREHIEHVLDGEAMAPNDRLAAEYRGVDDNAGE
jgi:hypothetical protein